MGARVYLPTLGRFLQVDPVEGGTDNTYVYANDPVNEFDLDGRFIPLVPIIGWTAVRMAAPHAARIAARYAVRPAVQFVQKRIPPVLSKKITITARKISTPIRTFQKKAAHTVFKYQWKNGNRVYNNKYLGVNSRLFGNARHGSRAGVLNNYSRYRIGWSHYGNKRTGYAVFRAATPKKHYNIFWRPKLWR